MQIGLALLLALLTGSATSGLFDRFGSSSQERILDADQAFQLTVDTLDPITIRARWIIAPGYYLYRDKLQLALIDAQGITIAGTEIPPGELKDDPYFGPQQIFHGEARLTAHLQRRPNQVGEIAVKVSYQGCAEIGVCYPPLNQTIAITLPAMLASPSSPSINGDQEGGRSSSLVSSHREAEQDRLARLLDEQRFLAIPAFFGFGLLLAFTPCVFPMVPILSSLIAGQSANLTRWRALTLALVYVLAMAATYTIAGVLAALLGQNLQAWFQNPWVIGLFSGLFILLALSMFGLYDLQLPTFLQHRLAEWSNHQRGGRYAGVAIMGFLSALIVGPCVAPPLIGALSFIAVTGDVALGAVALFVLSLGMGTPLLVIGASTGHWLPRAGHWMERIKAIFGVLLLAVALWLLERILPAASIMLLWATLLIVTAAYMGALQPVAHGAPAWRTLVKGLGTVLLIYGVLLLVGVASGGRDPWQPLRGVNFIASAASKTPPPVFRRVKTVADVEQALRQAGDQPVMLDFYADWCVTCKELERNTFSDPAVRVALKKMVTLQADVTAHDNVDRELLRHFNIVGPPAMLFFGADGQERREYRLVGFMDSSEFEKHLQTLPLD
ncbi:MAG: protein-disulfide reductase DsbD [Gammaproteobacteria bacterium]|nr:protein-disulfide reductase DsbD [Gammaproteobacteria bacterium]